MPKQQRSVRHVQINVVITVNVPDMAALASVDQQGRVIGQHPHRAAVTARDRPLRAFKELFAASSCSYCACEGHGHARFDQEERDANSAGGTANAWPSILCLPEVLVKLKILRAGDTLRGNTSYSSEALRLLGKVLPHQPSAAKQVNENADPDRGQTLSKVSSRNSDTYQHQHRPA